MDDFCKQAKIFTNRDDSLKHQIDHSRKLHKVYEKSLENATKNFRAHPEVHGMDDFLKPLPRLEDVASEKRQAAFQKPSVVVPKKAGPVTTGKSPALRQGALSPTRGRQGSTVSRGSTGQFNQLTTSRQVRKL